MKSNLFLIISEDKTIQDFNLSNILKKIEFNSDNKISYDMTDATMTDVIEEASMVSMFFGPKVVIATSLDFDKVTDLEFEYLKKYVEKASKDVYIILITNKIDARKKYYKIFTSSFEIIDGSLVKNNNFIDYIKQLVKEKGYKLDSYNIEYFLSKVGNNINNINMELEKLFIYKEDNKVITRDDIDLLIMDNIENIMYEFTNAILDKNYDKVFLMYQKFMKDNINFDYLISSIAGSIRTNLIIKILYNEGKNNSEISKIIGKKEFFVKKSIERLYDYQIEDLSNYLQQLAKIDYEFKSGKCNANMLEFFLLGRR